MKHEVLSAAGRNVCCLHTMCLPAYKLLARSKPKQMTSYHVVNVSITV